MLVNGGGIVDHEAASQALMEGNIPLNICLKRAVCHGQIEDYAGYPLRALLNKDIALILGSHLPTYYHTSLTDEYLAAVEQCGLSIDELEQLALNAVRASHMPPDDKATMVEAFQQAYAELHEEHLSEEAL